MSQRRTVQLAAVLLVALAGCGQGAGVSQAPPSRPGGTTAGAASDGHTGPGAVTTAATSGPGGGASSSSPPRTTSPPPLPPPAPVPGAPAPGVEWWHIPTTRHVVALTFDGGAGAQGAPSILSTLAAQRVTATFFLTGTWIEDFPTLGARIASGYTVGNHSYDHPHMPQLPASAQRTEILRTQSLIAGLGRDPRPLFRFPYGDRNASSLAIAGSLGYGSIFWTVDTLGWEGRSAGITTSTIVARVLAALRPGAIVLMHMGASPDGSTPDADALPALIAAIRAHGYGFVALHSRG